MFWESIAYAAPDQSDMPTPVTSDSATSDVEDSGVDSGSDSSESGDSTASDVTSSATADYTALIEQVGDNQVSMQKLIVYNNMQTMLLLVLVFVIIGLMVGGLLTRWLKVRN